MTKMKLPRAILIDMDDTILSAYGKPDVAWLAVVEEFAAELGPHSARTVAAAIAASGRAFWQNAEPHWRLKLEEARYEVVRNGFGALTASRGAPLPDEFAIRLADRFSAYRDEQMFLFPGVHETLQTFKAAGVKLALITNGAGVPQRRKIERFALTERFDHIQIEGEHGFGKPECGPTITPWVRSASPPPTPGWSATIWNGKSRCRNASAFTRSGWMPMARACRPTARSGRTALSGH